MADSGIVYEVDRNDPNLKEKLKKFLKALQEGDTYYQPFKKMINKR